MNEQTTELRDYIRILSKHRYLIILGTWLCVMAATAVTLRTVPVYQSSIQLLISQRSLAAAGSVGASAGESFQSIMVSERLAKTYSNMLQGRMMAQKVVDEADLDISSSQLVGRIKATPIRDTQLISVSVEDTDPGEAKKIVKAAGKVFSEVVEDIEGQDEVVSPVRVTQVEPAVLPRSPIKPKPVTNISLALMVGLIASSGLAFLLDSLDTSLKTSEEAERLLEVPIMGLIPKDKIIKELDLIVSSRPASVVAEAFRSLRTNVQYLNFDNSVKTIAITSSIASEGKTTSAVNLAAAMALAGQKVLIIDADLRHPSVHKYTGANSNVGLVNVLAGTVELDSAIAKTKIENLFALSTGPMPPNPAELLGSKHMKEVISKAGKKVDFVIIDTPPVLVVSDAAIVAPSIDGYLLVVHAGSTKRPDALQAKASIERVGGRLLGTIMNGVGKNVSSYGYYYSEDYYDKMDNAAKNQDLEQNQAAVLAGKGDES